MQVIEGNGARIPAIGIGTWELRGRACARIVEQALRLGYRHIDTAQMYANEREVGEALRASGLSRQDVFITTKISPQHFAPPDFARSVKEGLSRLRLSEVDLLLLHWPSSRIPLSETIAALAHAKREGYARHIGISNFDVALTSEAAELCPEPLACNQILYHPGIDQTALRQSCDALGIVVVAYSPIAEGRLKDHPVLKRIGAQYRKSPAQVALRWLVQQGVSAIPRTSRLERLSENLAVFDFELSEDDMTEIFALGRRSP